MTRLEVIYIALQRLDSREIIRDRPFPPQPDV